MARHSNSVSNPIRAWKYNVGSVAGLHLEDQGFPKKCGHLENKSVIPRAQYIAKIRAAVDARRDPDFLIIARTDARAMHGMDEAIARANEALAVGADMAFVEAAQSLDEVAEIPRRVNGPCLLNLVWKGKTPDVPFHDAESMGYKLAILPGMLMKAGMAVFDEVLAETLKTGRHAAIKNPLSPQEVFNRVGAKDWDVLSADYRQDA